MILEYEEPKNDSFIILESYPKEGSRNETQKSIYICKTGDKKTLNIGRAQQNELRIHDISISRNHAEISITNESKLYIRDVKSKFGTLVLVKSPEIIPEDKLTVSTYQIGRTVFIFNNPGKEEKSLGKALCAKLGGKKKLKKKDNKSKYETEKKEGGKDKAEIILELEVEKLQKNESEFFLDDEFYERMANDFEQKQNPEPIENDYIPLEERGSSHKTDDPDNQMNEEEDEGMNPLAQTHVVKLS